MYTLEDIMQQAIEDEYSTKVDTTKIISRLLHGCKISQDIETKKIEILNTAKGGEWYSKLTTAELDFFFEEGWKIGVYELSLSNYRTKLNRVEHLIKVEMNGRRNPKQIISLKASRESILNRYAKIKKKYNQIKSKHYDN
tara:strand:+ start:11764 stop:12183 length:420 start_codon:yes stop_codon:yes gene_type:complete